MTGWSDEVREIHERIQERVRRRRCKDTDENPPRESLPDALEQAEQHLDAIARQTDPD